jgi:hypothetical protein
MNYGLAKMLAVVFLSLTGALPAVAPDVTLDPLLQRVAQRLTAPAAAQHLQVETEEDLDKGDRTTSVLTTRSAQRLLPNGIQHGDVLEAVENGRDVTQRVRHAWAERGQQAQSSAIPEAKVDLEFRLPFEASQQGRYVFSVVAGSAEVPIVHFEPRGNGRRLWVGQASVDAKTGTILEMVGHPAILPRFVDQIDVHMEFRADGPPGPTPAHCVVKGGGHMLFIQKRMRYTLVTTASPAAF